jgi:hypothetical protein
MADKSKNFFIENKWLLTCVIVMAAALTAMFSISSEDFICELINCGDEKERYFDALNAFFTMLAFIGVVFTLFLQWKDLHETKKDVDEQNKTLALQRFEHSFFSMLSQHNEIISEIRIGNESGKWALHEVSKAFENDWKKCLMVESTHLEKIYKIFLVFGGDFKNNNLVKSDIFYSSLISLFRILNEQNNADFYADVIKSQFSQGELKLIFLYGLAV